MAMNVQKRNRHGLEKEFYFQWHITEKCNLRCAHCYQERYLDDDLPWEKIKEIADIIVLTLKRWGMLGRISLTGGEPFLSKNLFKLLSYLDNSAQIAKINILSNGTMLKESKVEFLRSIQKLGHVQVSLDGATPETHNTIRGQGTFEKTIKNIRILLQNDLEVAIMFTLHRGNMYEVPQLIDLAVKEGVNALTVERLTPCGKGNSLRGMVLSSLELKEVFEFISKRTTDKDVLDSGLNIRRARPLWVNTVEGDDKESMSQKVGGFCPVGLSSLAILHDGVVLPCRRLNIPLGNVLTDGIFKIWYTSEVLWNIRNKKNLKGKCKNCKQVSSCGGCRAVAYELNGDYLGEDPQCWI